MVIHFHVFSSSLATCVQVGSAVADGEYWRLLTAAFLHGNILHCGVSGRQTAAAAALLS
jgi:membrane associated rhomboid family serine protease